MSLRTFLRTYREEIDRRIRELRPADHFGPGRFNEAERRLYVTKNESLAAWARSLGVKL